MASKRSSPSRDPESAAAGADSAGCRARGALRAQVRCAAGGAVGGHRHLRVLCSVLSCTTLGGSGLPVWRRPRLGGVAPQPGDLAGAADHVDRGLAHRQRGWPTTIRSASHLVWLYLRLLQGRLGILEERRRIERDFGPRRPDRVVLWAPTVGSFCWQAARSPTGTSTAPFVSKMASSRSKPSRNVATVATWLFAYVLEEVPEAETCCAALSTQTPSCRGRPGVTRRQRILPLPGAGIRRTELAEPRPVEESKPNVGHRASGAR